VAWNGRFAGRFDGLVAFFLVVGGEKGSGEEDTSMIVSIK
jgi:hypothetical protein